jgi:MFS family permease
VLVPLLAGLALITIFTVRAVLIGSRALVDVRLFAGRTFSAATILLFGTGFVLYGAMLLVPLYLQQVRGSTAVAAGLILAPQGLGVILSRGLAGSLTDRIGARWITVAGIGITALATVPFAFISAHTSVWYLAGVLVVRGIGLGAVTIPVMTAAYLGLDRPQVPHASIMTRTAQQLGGSFGTAVLAVILQRALAASDAVAAYRTTFWWAVGFSAVAAIVALWLPAKPTSVSVRG